MKSDCVDQEKSHKAKEEEENQYIKHYVSIKGQRQKANERNRTRKSWRRGRYKWKRLANEQRKATTGKEKQENTEKKARK